MKEDETVGWHHRLNDMNLGRLGELVRDRRLLCCGPWGHGELDTIW